MTNAERQKRYRDKKRGGPVEGRWSVGHLTVADQAKLVQVGRTSVFMAMWISKYAPDAAQGLTAGTLKVTPTYKRLKCEYDAGVVEAIARKVSTDGERLVSSRRDGQFVFHWVKCHNSET